MVRFFETIKFDPEFVKAIYDNFYDSENDNLKFRKIKKYKGWPEDLSDENFELVSIGSDSITFVSCGDWQEAIPVKLQYKKDKNNFVWIPFEAYTKGSPEENELALNDLLKAAKKQLEESFQETDDEDYQEDCQIAGPIMGSLPANGNKVLSLSYKREQKSFANIWETNEEKLMTDYQLRSECLETLKKLKGKIFINKTTKIPIEINREIRGEMVLKIHISIKKKRPVARIKFLAIKALPYFLTDSDPDDLYEPDYKNRDQVEYSHVFKYKCQINQVSYLVHIRTRKSIDTENRLYFLNFEDLSLKEIS